VSGRDDCVYNGELEVEEAKEDLARGSGQAQLVCAHVIAFRTLTFSITVLGVETSAARTALCCRAMITHFRLISFIRGSYSWTP
jgi:hypothetical protein